MRDDRREYGFLTVYYVSEIAGRDASFSLYSTTTYRG